MIKVNIEKAKDIAHELRRTARSEEFKPLDEIIMKQIPGTDFSEIEKERQAIREKYKDIQSSIESASSVEEIKSSIDEIITLIKS